MGHVYQLFHQVTQKQWDRSAYLSSQVTQKQWDMSTNLSSQVSQKQWDMSTNLPITLLINTGTCLPTYPKTF